MKSSTFVKYMNLHLLHVAFLKMHGLENKMHDIFSAGDFSLISMNGNIPFYTH